MMKWSNCCYACGRPMLGTGSRVLTEDDGHQRQYVGPDCYQHVVDAGELGYQPPKGGPRLFVPSTFE